MTKLKNYINNRFVESTGAMIAVENPASGQMVGSAPDSAAHEVDEALDAASQAQTAWERRPAIERAGFLRKVAMGIRQRKTEIARCISEEQGKVMGLSHVEVSFTADYLDYMAEWARRIEGEILTSDRPNENIFLFRAAVGVVAGILPWNFPFFLIARKMAPALVTGNTIVIKPSEETPRNANLFAQIVSECDLPPGVFNVVYGSGPTVGKRLASSATVGMVSLTGSVEAGVEVMTAAAKNLTKVNLELGGKAPAIVLADANMDLAVTAIKNSRVINSGQVCNCAERIYVESSVADEFTDRMAAAMRTARYGDPLKDEDIEMGPLISARQLAKVESLVKGAVEDGAEVVTGGKRAATAVGHYYEPTVLTNVRQPMEIVRREVFGPVVPIIRFDDLDAAIAYANDSEYGLTSSIYTRDINVAMRACNELKFGETYINRENFEAMQGFHAGWRKSGIGGADGKHGLYEYTKTHVVYIQRNA